MTFTRAVVPYLPPYLVGLATFVWYQLLIFGPVRHVVGLAGIAACVGLSLLVRRRGARFLLCVPALVLAAWEYLVQEFMVVWWSLAGFAP